jgi:hypothetical protein
MLNHWNCQHCKEYNDILRNECWNCKQYKPDWITSIHQAKVEFNRDIFFHFGIFGIDISRIDIFQDIDLLQNEEKSMTPQEELFAKFYNEEVILVKDMDIVALREHRESLSQIALEAKARLVACDDNVRERTSKSRAKDLLTSDNSQPFSDALNTPAIRKARMSKMDKIKQDLLAAGIDEETVNDMVRNMERKATEKNLKTYAFTKPSKESDISVVKVAVVKDEPCKPFNPSSLKFNKD